MERLEERALLSLAFSPPIPFPSSTDQTSFASGDFNGDGIPDLVETNLVRSTSNTGYLNDRVSIKLGRGDGTFELVSHIDSNGKHPISVATGDFNNDGNTDFVVGENDSSFVTYQPSPYIDPFTGTLFYPLPVHIPITPSHLEVFLGRGDGSFQAGATTPVQEIPAAIAVADFNDDGKPDLATAGQDNDGYLNGGADVLLGQGDGTFNPSSTFLDASPGSEDLSKVPVAISAADFNGDGKPDLVVAKQLTSTADLLPGQGDGTFGSPTAINLGGTLAWSNTATNLRGTLASSSDDGAFDLLVGDFNGDGRPDLAAVLGYGLVSTSGLSVMLNQGHGSFQPPRVYQAGTAPSVAAVGDFNRDGRLDIAVANGNTVDVLTGLGDGTFHGGKILSSPSDISTLGDFNGDGIPDLITVRDLMATDHGITVGVRPGLGGGPFGPEQDYDLHGYGGGNQFHTLTLGDVNGDGLPDLMAGLVGGVGPAGHVLVLKRHGDGTFESPIDLPLGDYRMPVETTLGDVNGDGKPDIITVFRQEPSNTNITMGASVMLGHGDGTFDAPVDLPGSNSVPDFAGIASSVAVGDVNGDGKPDLALTEGATDTVLIYLNPGDSPFGDPIRVTVGPSTGPIAIKDLNGDGKPDLVVVAGGDFAGEGDNFAHSRVALLLGHGDGTFGPAVTVANAHEHGRFNGLSVGDVNGDGKPDLVATEQGYTYINGSGHYAQTNGSVDVFPGRGDGTFLAPDSYIPGTTHVSDPRLLDSNRDGHPDLFFHANSPLVERMNQGDGTFERSPRFDLTPSPTALLSVDFNNDGKPDLAALDKKGGTGVVLLNQTPVTDFPISAQSVPVQTVAGSTKPVVVASIHDLDPLGLASDFHVSVNWGDNTPDSAGIVTADGPGHFLVTGSHAYGRAGTFLVHVTVKDVLGSKAEADDTASVSMPSISVSSTTSSGTVGQSHTITVSLTNPDGTPLGAGVPVTFSITSGPNAGAMGTTNPTDGRTNSNGQVQFTYLGLGGVGTDTIIARATLPGGATLTASPASVTWTASTTPVGPTVVNLQRLGYHRYPTRLVLSFSEPMDPIRAGALSNYSLSLIYRGRRLPIRLRHAHYHPESRSVTLVPGRLLPLRFTYQITVNGAAPSGLASRSGTPLDGRGDGEPGTPFEARIDRSSLFLTSLQRGPGTRVAALLLAARRRRLRLRHR